MTDFSSLTLTTTRPTTTAPALIAWNEKREADRAAREAWRVERVRRGRALELAAIESQSRPVVVPQVRERRPVEPGTYAKDLELYVCKGSCGQMTRARCRNLTEAPGTVRRWKDGKCRACYTGRTDTPTTAPVSGDRFRPCAGGCGKMTRPAKMGVAEAPNTVPRKLHGKCSTCLTGGPSSVPPKVDPALLVAAYADGKSLDTIAAEYHLSPTTTRDYLLRAGVTMRGKGEALRGTVKTYPPELVEAVRRHYHDDLMSVEQTAKAVGKAVDTVMTIMRRNDIPSRGPAGLRSRNLRGAA